MQQRTMSGMEGSEDLLAFLEFANPEFTNSSLRITMLIYTIFNSF